MAWTQVPPLAVDVPLSMVVIPPAVSKADAPKRARILSDIGETIRYLLTALPSGGPGRIR